MNGGMFIAGIGIGIGIGLGIATGSGANTRKNIRIKLQEVVDEHAIAIQDENGISITVDDLFILLGKDRKK